MSANRKKLENRVLETANRLRLVQVDFADKSRKARVDYLCEEIERALKNILPEERKDFLQKLLERFPTGTFAPQPFIQEQESNNISGIDEVRLKDADFLVQCLSEIIPTLSIDQKESVTKRLQQIGLGSGVRETYPDESIKKLMAKLQLDYPQDFNIDRLTELIIMLVNFVYKLEPLGWNTWRRLAPRSKVRQSGNLKKAIGQFLSNDPKLSQQLVNSELKELRQLIAALITATSRVGSQFAQHYLDKFSPHQIIATVKYEEPTSNLSKILLTSRDQRCWKKYCDLAGNLAEESIETEITKAIVNYVESLVRGMGR